MRNSSLGSRFACIALLALGCGGGDDDAMQPASTSAVAAAIGHTAQPTRLANPTPFFRVDLALGAQDAVELRGLARPVLTVAPMQSLTAEYLLVSYAGADVVSAMPVAFERVGHRTKRGADGRLVHEEHTIEGALATVFVEAAPRVDRLALVAPDGKVLVDVPGDRLAAAEAKAKAIGGKAQSATVEELRTRYPHIVFLREGQDAAINEILRTSTTRAVTARLITPTEQMNDVIDQGLSRAAPAVLASIRSIAVARTTTDDHAGDYAWQLGSTLVLNADNLTVDAEGPATVLHEATHIFTDLLDAAATHDRLERFAPPLRAPAQTVVRRFDLGRGFAATWRQLHESGVDEGVTRPYRDGEVEATLSQAQANREGFATQYGATDEYEDIAEYVGTLEAPYAGNRGICPLLSGARSVTPTIAIPFAKLVFLLSLEAITEAAFNACALNVAIDPPVGIRFPKVEFQAELRAGRRVAGATSEIGIQGAGPNSYRILIQIALPTADGSALGLHRLASVAVENVNMAGLNGVFLANENPRLGRGSARGFVLVTEVSATHLAGLVFGLVLQNGARTATDRWSLGTFSVPL